MGCLFVINIILILQFLPAFFNMHYDLVILIFISIYYSIGNNIIPFKFIKTYDTNTNYANKGKCITYNKGI